MTQSSPALARVRQGDLCAGCGGCAAVAPEKIRMRLEEPGFLRPQQVSSLTAAEETLIKVICPGLGQKVAAAGRMDDPLWGPYVAMHAGWAKDDTLRFVGASGGALSGILVHLVTAGIVDAVIQTTASPDLAIGNATVITTDLAEIARAAGSRYAPSAPLEELRTHLESGKRFAFVGKPCDVAALRALMEHDTDIALQVSVVLSFFCAGVPSHAGGEAILTALGTRPDEALAFRYRGNGWPGRATVTRKDNTERSMSYHDSWGGILSKHVQHRCRICADGTGKAADIVCADAWVSDERGYPVFDEAPGVSLIVARTEQGAALLAAAHAANRIALQDFDVDDLVAIQPGQRERRRALLARLIGRRLSGKPIPKYTGLNLRTASRQNPLPRNIKNMLGMIRRSFRKAK